MYRGSDGSEQPVWYRLEVQILFASRRIYVCFMLMSWKWPNHINLHRPLAIKEKKVVTATRALNFHPQVRAFACSFLNDVNHCVLKETVIINITASNAENKEFKYTYVCVILLSIKMWSI
jgi:hypothetical protein